MVGYACLVLQNIEICLKRSDFFDKNSWGFNSVKVTGDGGKSVIHHWTFRRDTPGLLNTEQSRNTHETYEIPASNSSQCPLPHSLLLASETRLSCPWLGPWTCVIKKSRDTLIALSSASFGRNKPPGPWFLSLISMHHVEQVAPASQKETSSDVTPGRALWRPKVIRMVSLLTYK